jgi:hypothetical protein
MKSPIITYELKVEPVRTLERTSSTIMVAMLLLAALSGLLVPASADVVPELVYSSIHDYALDRNANSLYDALVVEVSVEVTVAGTYTIVGRLIASDSGTPKTVATVFSDELLEVGNNTFQLEFDSEDIYRNPHVGAYTLDLEATKLDYAVPFTATTQTRFYDYMTFESVLNPPPVPPDAPKVELDIYYVNITTSVFQVFVNRTSPEVLYRYRELRPGLPDFLLRFTRLLFFSDDGDGMYNGEDLKGDVELESHPWAFTNVQVSGPKVTFDLKSRLPIKTATEYYQANVTFSFVITNGSSQGPGESGFIRGHAAELKFDIVMEFLDDIEGANMVALEARVTDTLASHDYLVQGPTGFLLHTPDNDTDYAPVPRIPGNRATVIGMVDDNLVEHAFVGWLNLAGEDLEGSDGEVEVPVGPSFRFADGALELLLAYPYSAIVDELSHDPSVGILEENLPPQQPEPTDGDDSAPNFYMWLFAALVGAVILILSVYARAKGY